MSSDPEPGVLLVNLGTPAAPEPAAVRRYLREFLSDPLVIDIADAITMLSVLFTGAPAPPCADACDANDDGQFNVGDAVYLLNFLFIPGSPPPPPPGMCGCDPTECAPDRLDCVSGPCP